MITEIGITSGEIWHYLDENNCASIAELVKATGRSKELVLMSIGWLGREGHVRIEGNKRMKVCLNKNNQG